MLLAETLMLSVTHPKNYYSKANELDIKKISLL
jgi:hypothetical protein